MSCSFSSPPPLHPLSLYPRSCLLYPPDTFAPCSLANPFNRPTPSSGNKTDNIIGNVITRGRTKPRGRGRWIELRRYRLARLTVVTALFRFSRRPFNSTGEGGTRECVNVCMYAGEEEGVIDRRPGKPFVPLLPSLRPRVIRQVTWIFAIGRCTRCFQKWRSSYLLPSLPSPVVVKRVNSVVASYLG